MTNEKGFIFPSTMFLCLLLIHILMIQIHLYQTEKSFIYEQERYLQLDSLFQVGITEFQKEKYKPTTNQAIVFSYDIGTVEFITEKHIEGISSILVTARLNSGHRRIGGFRYDQSHSVISGYWEVVQP